MGIAKKQGSIAAIITYTGIIIGYVNVAFLFPKFMDAESLGLRQLLVNFSSLASQVSLLGFAGVTYKYIPFVREVERYRKSFLAFILIVPFLGVLLISLLIIIFESTIKVEFADESALFSTYFYLIFPLNLIITLNAIVENYSRSLFKSIPPLFLKEIVLKLLGTILIAFYALEIISYEQFWNLFVGSYAFIFIALLAYLASIKKLGVHFDLSFIQKINLKELFNYAAYGFFSGSATTIILYIDSLMILYILDDLEFNGIYTLAVFIATLVDVPRRSLLQIIAPIIAEASKKEDKKTLSDAYSKTSLNMLVAGVGVLLLIIINLDKLYEFIPNGEVYAPGFYAVCFLGLTKLVNMGFSANAEIIGYSKYYRYALYNNIFLAVLGVFTNLYFIPIYGITGAALATFISYVIYNLNYFLFIYIKFSIQPFTFRSLGVLLVGLGTMLILYFVPEMSNKYLSIIVKSSLIIGLYGGAILAFKISPDVNDLVFKILRIKR